MLTLGIDPDVHQLSLVALRDGVVELTLSTNIPKAFKGDAAATAALREFGAMLAEVGAVIDGAEAIAVEGQQQYEHSRVDPADLLLLARAAGGAIGLLAFALPEAAIYVPKPHLWKGSVPKSVHQARTVERLEDPHRMLRHSHLIDAAGLAAWAAERLALDREISRRSGSPG